MKNNRLFIVLIALCLRVDAQNLSSELATLEISISALEKYVKVKPPLIEEKTIQQVAQDNPLIEAVLRLDLPEVKKILSSQPGKLWINQVSKSRSYPLFWSIGLRDLMSNPGARGYNLSEVSYQIFKLLLENGAVVDMRGWTGMLPIHKAAEIEDVAFAKDLLQKNISLINEIDDWGNTPLDLAMEKGLVDMVKLLLQNGADVLVRVDKKGDKYSKLAVGYKGNIERSLLFSIVNVLSGFNEGYKARKDDVAKQRLIESTLDNIIEIARIITPLMKEKNKDSINWKQHGGMTALALVNSKLQRKDLVEPVKKALNDFALILQDNGATT